MIKSDKKITKILIGIIVCVFACSVFTVPAEIFATGSADMANDVEQQSEEAVTTVETDAVEEPSTEQTEEMSDVRENSTDIEEQAHFEYEEQANSWRYQGGYNSTYRDGAASGGSEAPKARARAKASFTPWSEVNGEFVNDEGKVISGAIRRGIDVSEWQGDINWSQVKASGIDFAIIRCGFGKNITKYDDAKWARNVSECERLGIPYGVYFYSYADSVADAKDEAQHALRLLEGHNPEYPVYYDLEDADVAAAGKSTIIKIADTFCSTIEDNGYRAGIYANLNWWNNKLNSSSLNKYEKWVAQYYHECQYKGDYRLWQCTSSGSVPGIEGNVDIDFEFWREDSAVDVADYNVVLTSGRNVRTGPHTAFKSVGYYVTGTRLTITHKSGNWGKIKNTGRWVELLASQQMQDVEDYNIVLTSGRNIRSGPKTSCGKVGYYIAGSRLTITHRSGDWGRLKNTGRWVELLASQQMQDVKDYNIMLTSGRNIRTGPKTAFKKVGYYIKGTRLTITHRSGDWGRLKNTGRWVELLASKPI